MTDLISRADALEQMAQAECGLHYNDCEADNCSCSYIQRILDIPSADAVDVNDVTIHYKPYPSANAVQGYAEWLEKIIVDAETLEWLCEDTPCKEWCDENCHYKSIQAECLRHMYEVSKGGDTE